MKAVADKLFFYPPNLKSAADKKHWFFLSAGLVLSLLIPHCYFIYSDILDTFDGSVLLLESLVHGEITNFYQYAAVNSDYSTVYTANYNVLMYVIFLLWNLPAALLHVFTDFQYLNSTWAVLWCKAIIPVSLFLCAQGIFYILRTISIDRKSCFQGSFLFLSSMCVFLGAMCASQYDSIMLCFEIWGLYCFIRRKNRCFLLLFAIAIPLKLFPVFLLFPLLCIRYKKVWKILLLLTLAFIPNILLGLPFRNDVYYQAALGSQNKDALSLMLSTSKTGGVFSAFIIIFLIVSIWCFFRDTSPEEEPRFCIYIAFIIFSSFVVFVPIRSYWILLFVPFSAIMIMSEKNSRFFGVLLETIGGVCGAAYYLMSHWIYRSGVYVRTLFLPNEPASGMEYCYNGFASLMDSLGITPYCNLFLWGFVVCLAALAFVYFPRKNPVAANAGGRLYTDWGILYWRLISVFIVMSLIFYARNATRPVIAYGNDSQSNVSQTVSVLNQTYSQSGITFAENTELSEFGVLLISSNNGRNNRSMLHFSLVDEASGQTVWTGTLPVCLIQSGTYHTIDMENTPIQAEASYRLEIDSSLLKNDSAEVMLVLGEDELPAVFFR